MSLPAGAYVREGVAYTAEGAMCVASVGTASITGGTITGTNVPYTLSQSGIPFIHLSTGSIGNNGALTAVTALSRTYSDGAYIWLPAGAIAAGVPAAAAWYWCIFSSTTAGTIYNSTYTSGTPVVGTQTAFATTGPGAFTGSIAEATGPSITLPAGAVGANGQIIVSADFVFTNSGGNKTYKPKLGTTALVTQAVSTQVTARIMGDVANKGAANRQLVGMTQFFGGGVMVNSGAVAGTEDTSPASTLSITLTRDTATDNFIIERYRFQVAYGA